MILSHHCLLHIIPERKSKESLFPSRSSVQESGAIPVEVIGRGNHESRLGLLATVVCCLFLVTYSLILSGQVAYNMHCSQSHGFILIICINSFGSPLQATKYFSGT